MSELLVAIPEVELRSAAVGSRMMPVIGLGTGRTGRGMDPTKAAVIEAIRSGYRHFDTAALYKSEEPLGEAIAEAISLGLIRSRDELFITSKLWCSDAHADLVIPAIRKSLRALRLDFLDLYLIHWPISCKPGNYVFPIDKAELMPMDFRAVWTAMEECQSLGLTKSIGLSNFSINKIQNILSFAGIPPSVNQVEMNPAWQQKKLREFCKEKGIVITAFSPLGSQGPWASGRILNSPYLKEIASAHGKTVAQVGLRWLYEKGVTIVAKSFNKERMAENLNIFDWELTEEDHEKIGRIPQKKIFGEDFISADGPYKSEEELWDGDC